MLNRHSVWTRTALVFVSLMVAVPAMSQTFYGSLVTVVSDAQGGVIPGATVILINTATNERRERVSTEDGSARFLNLVPGTYRLEVELTGFQRSVREGIAVNVNTAPRIEVRLELGNLSETITVAGEAAVLQTENASIGIVMESSRIRQLSLNGGNVLNLITLAPSVVPQGGSEGSLTGKNVFAAGNYQIGGGTANQSASYFDGVTVQDSAYGNIVVLTPSPEAVEEFRVQTNNSSAEFGRFTGGVVNIASRSGTNPYRGCIFEQHRNKALNSNTFFGERAGLDKPPFVQNNFGGSMGGPVLTNKLFFFGSFEGYRNREGVLFRRTVPTAAMKNGDFSDYRGSGTTVVPIYDPWTQCGINNPGTGVFNGVCGAPGVPNRQQFPSNIIPANRISPIAKKFLNFPIYAEPTVAGRWTTNNFEKNASIGGDNNQVNVRADYNMSQNNRIIGRYTRFDSTNLPVDVVRQRPDQRRSVLARAFHHDAGDGGRHVHLQLVDGAGRAVWSDAVGLRSHPGQPGDGPGGDVRSSRGALRPDSRTQRRSAANPSKHQCRLEPGHRHRSHLRGRLYVFAHADAHQNHGRSHREGGREHPERRGQLLSEQQRGRHVHVRQQPDGARRHGPRRNGRSVRVVSDRSAHRRDVPVIEFQLRPYAVPGVLCRGFVADDPPADREPWNAPGEAGCVLRDGRPPRDLQPRLGQPASGREDQPGNGKAVPRCVRVSGELRATGAHAEEEPPAVRAACRRGVSSWGKYGPARRWRDVLRALDRTISRWADGQPREHPNQ